MAALPDVPNVLKCALIHTYATRTPVVVRFYMQYDGPAPSDSDCLTYGNSIGDRWNSNIASLCHTNVNLDQVEVVDLTSETAGHNISSPDHPGTLTGTNLPPSTALVSSFTVQRRYRGGHPRAYWPVGNTNQITSDHLWSSGFVGDCTTGIGTFFNEIGSDLSDFGATGGQVNVSYYKGFENFEYPSGRIRALPKLRIGGPVVDPVTGYVIRNYLANQRRRDQ
jgi:hypothetical protein